MYCHLHFDIGIASSITSPFQALTLSAMNALLLSQPPKAGGALLHWSGVVWLSKTVVACVQDGKGKKLTIFSILV